MRTTSPVERICAAGLDDRTLRAALLAQVREDVPFDWYAWLLTDPLTCVGAAPVAATPSLAELPALIRLKYLTPANRWTGLPPGAVVTLADATDGDLEAGGAWAAMLAAYGVHDVASTVFRDPYGCWGFLDLWRKDGRFTMAERAFLAGMAQVATPALRRSLVPTFALSAASAPWDEPAVLLLTDSLAIVGRTPPTDRYLRTLLPTDADRAPIAAGAYNVAAQLLAQEAGVDDHSPVARVHLELGQWVTFRAARVAGASSTDASIAVTIEPTPPTERAALWGCVIGLSDRERELLQHLVAGHDTHAVAARMFVSEHTVQDHLKSIFAKAGVRTRRTLVARATGTG